MKGIERMRFRVLILVSPILWWMPTARGSRCNSTNWTKTSLKTTSRISIPKYGSALDEKQQTQIFHSKTWTICKSRVLLFQNTTIWCGSTEYEAKGHHLCSATEILSSTKQRPMTSNRPPGSTTRHITQPTGKGKARWKNSHRISQGSPYPIWLRAHSS